MSQEHYPDEKLDVEAGLSADTAPLLKQTDREHVIQHPQRRQLSTKKKLLLGGLAGFFIFSAARACHSRHHRNGLQKWSGEWDKLTPSSQAWDYEKETWVRV